MQFNIHSFNLDNPESCLIILIYAGFWGYSYYALILLLIHTYKRNRSIESASSQQSHQAGSTS
ncbi:MAG: hypothetical protein AAGE84_31925 [Cyanobacteria bacterium P01_G01_bin.39]